MLSSNCDVEGKKKQDEAKMEKDCLFSWMGVLLECPMSLLSAVGGG